MSCGDHNHGESCSHGGHDDPEMGLAYSLFSRIDMHNVQCLNESVDGAGKTVFKPWDERLTMDQFVESDADGELLFNIPFTDNIKLKGLILIGGEDGSHPNKIRLFKNRPHMTFDDATQPSDQEFELQPDPTGTAEYTVKVVKFSSVTHLSLHIPGNLEGGDLTRVFYIGFRGEFTKAHRHGVTLCTYETTPQMSDHETKAADKVGRPIE